MACEQEIKTTVFVYQHTYTTFSFWGGGGGDNEIKSESSFVG